MNRRSFLLAGSSAIACSPILSAANGNTTLACIGDHGNGKSPFSHLVGGLVNGWNPDAIFTLGDNSYGMLAGRTYRENNQMYDSAIRNSQFFPSIGNHDLDVDNGQLYAQFFNLPKYYSKQIGPVLLVMLNCFPLTNIQIAWAKRELQESDSPWKLVCGHLPAYSSAGRGDSLMRNTPFHEWGANIVLGGHDHIYERYDVDGKIYIVNGLGGKSIYNFAVNNAGLVVRYRANFGAIKIIANSALFKLEFTALNGDIVDTLNLANGSIVVPSLGLLL